MVDRFLLKGFVFDRLSDDEFFRFCQENKDWKIERNHKCEILIMEPTGAEGGMYEASVITELGIWNKASGAGKVFSSNAGFTLSDGSMFSPDASWVSNEKWESVSASEKQKFAALCPEFVVEIRSRTDRIDDLKVKMNRWVLNGAQLAWLIDPYEEKAYIYAPGAAEKVVVSFDAELSADPLLPGFVLSLKALRG